MNTDFFLRRMQNGRLRQLSISAVSIVLAGLCVALFSSAELGGFSYYAIVILLVINSILALLQFQQVIRPVESLLTHLTNIAARLEANDYRPLDKLSAAEGDVFGCLSAAMDGIVETMLSRINALTETASASNEMLMALPFAVLILTKDGAVAKLLNANGMGNTLRGFRLGEKPREDFWGADNIASMDAALQRASSCSETVWCDLTVSRPDGYGDELYRLTLRRLNGMSVMMTILNVTDRKDIAAPQSAVTGDTKGVQAAVAQNRAILKRMAASIAHDGKNIFAALSNLVALNRDSTDPNVRDQVPVAEDAIRRGTTLMKELTTFAGESRLELKCVPAAPTLRNILETPAIKALLPSNVQLLTSVSDKALPEVDIDSDQMWKVIFNLVKNAVEALGANGGRIWAKIEPTQMSSETACSFRHTATLRVGEGVLLTMADDGPGIPEDVLDRIFEPYTSVKGEGRGIGLATVMTIIDAHGGAISVKSSPGYGTTFYIYLPASRNTAEDLRIIREVAPNGEILLVDDDPTILHTTSLVLRSLKIAAHPASNEEDAIAKLRSLRGRIRAALVDGNIGCICSSGLVRRIRNEFPGLPVIIVSGSPKETIDNRFAGVPYDRFLAKPYSVADLSKTLQEVTPQA